MAIPAENPLSAIALSRSMCSSLSTLSAPQLKNPYDAVAVLAHACMLAVDFRLVGLGEDDRLNGAAKDRKRLPENWNATTSWNYAFRFAHSQSSLQYLVKISRLGGKAVINGLGIGDDKVHTVDFHIKDFFSESSFPFTLPSSSNNNDPDRQLRSLQNIFISPGRMADLASTFKLQIIQKLAPALQKEGYEESAHAASQRDTSRQHIFPPHHNPPTSSIRDPLRDDRLPRPPHPSSPPFAQPGAAIYDPLAGHPPPRRPFPAGDFPPPGFEDEYEINRPLARGWPGGERRPLNIGERDLYPPGLGPHDPLRSGGGIFGGGEGGGGMHPTLDDPIFGGGGRGGQPGIYNGRIPPGARYDPISPDDGPPNLFIDSGGMIGRGRGLGGFGGGSGGGGRRQQPPNPFAGYGGNDFI